MNELLEIPEAGQRRPVFIHVAFFLSITGALLTAGAILLATLLPESGIGPAQPIPFSHRVHTHDKKLSCFFCHTQARFTANAGVPPLQTCMLCHRQIIITYPPIEKLRHHFATKTPVAWTQVNRLPDFVYFNHAVHIQRGVDCGRCHGEVLQMDRIEKARKINMGFCMQCHREQRATIDCFTCHR